MEPLMTTFRALRATKNGDVYSTRVEDFALDHLPAGEVLIRVHYSSVNFKDLLVTQGARGLTKTYPHTPGIDAAGVVEESSLGDFSVGDPVLVTGFDLGINTPGGFGQYIRVPGSWVQKIPQPLGPKEAMIFGTAGLTAGLSILEFLDHGLQGKIADGAPGPRSIAVTGASGGVGSLAIPMLAELGFSVTAITNKTDDETRLKALGASEELQSKDFDSTNPKHLLTPRWAGVLDTVGGTILANLVKETHYGGVVTNCGMVAGNEMNISVFPFLIRGVRLIGIDSVLCPVERRARAWQLIADLWSRGQKAGPMTSIDRAYTEVNLENLPQALAQKSEGKLRGRTLVSHD